MITYFEKKTLLSRRNFQFLAHCMINKSENECDQPINYMYVGKV